MIFKKFLSFLFPPKTEAKLGNEIDAIIAPINKIVAKLERYIQAKCDENERQEKELEALREKLRLNDEAQARAVLLCSRYRNLIDAESTTTLARA